MKKVISVLMSFLAWAFVASMIGAEAPKIGMSPLVLVVSFLVVTVLMALKAKKSQPFGIGAAVAVEQWVPYIIERLFKDNMFLQYAYNDDQYVLGGQIVHIPQPGAQPTVNKNNSSYPVAVVRRVDTDVTYSLDAYTTVPSHIPDVDLAQISYDEVTSIITDHFGFLIQAVADDMLYKWLNGLGSGKVVRTTGAATAATEVGQTGNRLALKFNDLKTARTKMNKANVPKDRRYAIIESNMLDQLVSDLTLTQYRDFSREYDAVTGTVGNLAGFGIIERSSAGMVQDAVGGGVVANDFLTAAGATDDVACVCYQANAVARALGERKLFQKIGDPQYYGDVYSTLVRAGGRRRRSDDNGMIAIVQAQG